MRSFYFSFVIHLLQLTCLQPYLLHFISSFLQSKSRTKKQNKCKELIINFWWDQVKCYFKMRKRRLYIRLYNRQPQILGHPSLIHSCIYFLFHYFYINLFYLFNYKFFGFILIVTIFIFPLLRRFSWRLQLRDNTQTCIKLVIFFFICQAVVSCSVAPKY